MVDYLVKIREESYRILEEDFKDVFKAIDCLMEEQRFDDFTGEEFKEDDMFSGAIDLMSSDTEMEDEEMIGSETDEDCAFVDDEVVDE